MSQCHLPLALEYLPCRQVGAGKQLTTGLSSHQALLRELVHSLLPNLYLCPLTNPFLLQKLIVALLALLLALCIAFFHAATQQGYKRYASD
jgi:hypothetical protein